MADESKKETVSSITRVREGLDVNWTRLEGLLSIGALLASFLWFLGMPTGMAIGVGFGIVLLLDCIRRLIFGSARSERSDFDTPEIP